MAETVIVEAETDEGAETGVVLESVAAAGAAAGVAAANAQTAEQSAILAGEAARSTENVAEIAMEAASSAQGAAARAEEAEYATATQVAAMQSSLDGIHELLLKQAETPAPTSPKPAPVKRDKSPTKTHFLKRRIGGK